MNYRQRGAPLPIVDSSLIGLRGRGDKLTGAVREYLAAMVGNTLVAQDACPSADAARLPWKILLIDPASHLTAASGGPTRYAYLTNDDYLATFATEPQKGRISITLSLDKNLLENNNAKL